MSSWSQSFTSRRSFLRSVNYGFGALAFAAMHRSTALSADVGPLSPKKPHFEPRAKRILMLCMEGGPSHVDTFDYKPLLAEREGKPIGKGKVPGGKLMKSPWNFEKGGESGLWISDLYKEVRSHADNGREGERARRGVRMNSAKTCWGKKMNNKERTPRDSQIIMLEFVIFLPSHLFAPTHD
jgi:hypothetical protein